MPDRPIIVRNACIIAGRGRAIPCGFILARGGTIESLGDDSRAPDARGARAIDARGRYVLPGLVNPHMHLYGMLALGAPARRARAFGQVLERLWWRLDRALTLDDVHASALLGAIASVRAGVTTVFDHHASYGAIRGSLHTVSEAVRQVGLRACLSFEISDRGGRRLRDEAAEESASFLESIRARIAREPGCLQRGMVGLHASMTLSDATIEAARELMEVYGVGAHVHVAEGAEDVAATRRRFRITPAARFAEMGVLRRGSIAAHCVHVNGRDISLLKRSGATVAHNPMSNLANAVGVAPVLAMARAGVPVAIGTDGMSAGISQDALLASVVHRAGARDAQAGMREAAYAIWGAAPELASGAFGCGLGRLRRGAAADFIIVDAVPRTPVTAANAEAHLIFGALSAPVRTTIVAGRELMRDFEIRGFDEVSLAARARRLAARLWKRM
ncbi:MAG: amidohydrolase family protein [Proteobacteria bacterium]|nr:amidohydrolase family protein [Pseudomonadota bacterium]